MFIRQGNHTNRAGCFFDDDGMVFINFEAGLAVEGQHDIRRLFSQADSDGGGIRNNQRAVGQRKRTDRRHEDAGDRRMDHGAAGRQGVGG